MIYVDHDDNGLQIYMVTNNYDQCLIRTTSRGIAYFVDSHTPNLKPNMFLLIGGDSGSRRIKRPIFHHLRRY